MICCDFLFSHLHQIRTRYWICAWECLKLKNHVCSDQSASPLWSNGTWEAHPDDLQSIQEPLCSILWVSQPRTQSRPRTGLGSRRSTEPVPYERDRELAVASEQEGAGGPAERSCRNILLHLGVGDSGEDSYHGSIRAAGWVRGVVVFSREKDCV